MQFFLILGDSGPDTQRDSRKERFLEISHE